ncbi:MAG: TetR/AcrR family transcriptional regulator [Gordonia sp. (in: high G+C Gram-positive bacteria)]
MGEQGSTAHAVRTRPRDRREQILTAAATAFSRRGYHATTLAHIADAAGISAPAMYRHFGNKYELFAETNRVIAVRVRDRLDAVPVRPDEPEAELRNLLASFATLIAENRHSADLHSREPSILADADRALVREVRIALHRRARGLLQAMRADLSRADADVLAAAMFIVVVSPSTHRIPAARKAIVDLTAGAAITLAAVELPPALPSGVSRGLVPSGRREAILARAVDLFAAHGYHDVSVEQIASAVGMPTSGVYRHFPSKQAVLVAALSRASDRATAAIATGLASAADPADALSTLTGEYARLCAADPAIITVYLSNLGAIDGDEHVALRRQQRTNVDEWATWLQSARPDVGSAAARFLVHASLNTMSDLTSGRHPVDSRRAAALGSAVLWAPA